MKNFDLMVTGSIEPFTLGGKQWQPRVARSDNYSNWVDLTLATTKTRRAKMPVRGLLNLSIEFLAGTDAMVASGAYTASPKDGRNWAGLVDAPLADRALLAELAQGVAPGVVDAVIEWVMEQQTPDLVDPEVDTGPLDDSGGSGGS